MPLDYSHIARLDIVQNGITGLNLPLDSSRAVSSLAPEMLRLNTTQGSSHSPQNRN